MPDPVTPAEALEQKLAELDAEIARLRGERDLYARALAVLRGDLLSMNKSDTPGSMRQMQGLERIRHSKVPHGKQDARVDRFLKACHAKGETMREAAEALSTPKERVYQPQLSAALRGTRPIWMPLAKRIEKRYGYAATLANWPDLRGE